jgi:hypothetical protein
MRHAGVAWPGYGTVRMAIQAIAQSGNLRNPWQSGNPGNPGNHHPDNLAIQQSSNPGNNNIYQKNSSNQIKFR